ncbi:MAG: aminopeptidase [Kofleriaceae bacterium]|nr:MAG: aminopeptidase [Kofleriaceae bacterium]MBZ0237482.1 aminopeptidase [Kofleriaceae bacterium]
MSRAIALLLAAVALGGCLMTRYLAQAASGQLRLMSQARPIEEVIADPETPERTRVLLAEIEGVKAFGARMGLDTSRNYTKYVEVPASGTVWFVGAAPPLSFEARSWCFPIAGCFTGLGWFDEAEALRHRDQLLRDGWDAMARPAGAYSTGGWFPDPVVSSMLSPDEDAYAWLANILLHESVHATVLIPDEMYFNEGLAEYVGDALTDVWLVERFGPMSPERAAWTAGQAERRERVDRSFAAFQALDALYKSTQPDPAKLAAKARIIDELVEDLELWQRPNNASLVELRLYKAHYDGFARLEEACGDARTLLEVAGTLERSDFEESLQEDLTPVLALIEKRCRKNSGSARPAVSR